MATDNSTELVHLSSERGVSTITLDSPHNRNALSAQLRAELHHHLEVALADVTTRVIVLTHTGPVFCAGADLREARGSDPAQSGEELARLLAMLLTAEKPVVARLYGPARAGGTGLVAACDFAVAADTVDFAFTEVRIGVIPSIISVPLRLRVAAPVLQRLFLTGATFDAQHAADIGLISHTAPTGDVDHVVDGLVGALQLGSPTALAGVKKLLVPPVTTLSEQLAEMQNLTAQYFSSANAQEGIRAFAEKRPPAWVSSATAE